MINLSEYLTNGDNWLYNVLSKEKLDTFPTNYTLDIRYTGDRYKNSDTAGESLLKLQEYLTMLDIPNFFVIIHTNNLNIINELRLAKNTFAPFENDIRIRSISGVFDRQLSTVNSLCLYPWIHVFVNPQGKVGTCCEFDEQFALGNISDGPLSDIANNENMKKVRRQMLSNQRPEICSACWKNEDAGLLSGRQKVNAQWGNYKNLTNLTKPDGTFSEFKLRYLDIRLSNICNLKCKMCGSSFSSRIAHEHADMFGDNKFIELKLSSAELKNTLEFVENNIINLDIVHFAGGEPLIMAEHYQVLDLLIKHQRTDIPLSYNSNFTVLKYKNFNIIEYWKQFNTVIFRASIDLIGEQAGYVRHGTNYDDIEENYSLIKDYVDFEINSIVHMLNIFNLPKLQYRWITVHQLPAKALSFRIMIIPSNMSVQVLPTLYKTQAENYILDHIRWLESIADTEHLVSSWKDVLQYMYASDQSHLLGNFFKSNDMQDTYRCEKFEEVFPEYINLRSYV